MASHKALTGINIHVVSAFTYADAAARAAATGFAAADVGKVAWQTDNNSLWLLTATTPTWVQVGATLPFASLTSTPTTLAGYGITDAASDTELATHEADTTSIHGIADTSLLLDTGDLTASHNHTSASTDGGVLTNDAHDGYSEYAEMSAPSTPAGNKLRLYAKDKAGVSALYWKDDGGTEYDLSAMGGGGGVSDGDKGDVTVSSSGTVWTVDNDAVTYAKIQDVSATNRLLGRATSGAGNVEEITLGTNLSFTGTTLNAAGGGGSLPPYIKIVDSKASGTDGGGFTAGSWVTRDLNTVKEDLSTIASLGSNQITLPAGTYMCRISTPGYNVVRMQARLRDITNTATLLNSTSEFAANAVQTRCEIVGHFTLAGSTILEVQHQCASTQATFGLGVAADTSFTVAEEIYTVAEFWKEA